MKKIGLLVLLIIAFEYSFSQLATIKFNHLTVRDGLPERQVQFLKQDSRGYMWIGTQNGLVKYDGYKPKVYRFGIADQAISPNCSVVSMLEDHDNNLWFSTTGNGLFRYNPVTDNFIQYIYPQKPGKKDFIALLLSSLDNDNNLWGNLYSLNGNSQLMKFNTKTTNFESYNKTQSGIHFSADYNTISKMADGRMIFKTDYGLFTYNNQTKAFKGVMTSPDTSRRIKISQVYEAPSTPGIIWMNLYDVHSKKKILRCFNTTTKLIKDYYLSSLTNLSNRNDSINAIFEDKQKHLWFATQHGLLLLNRKTGNFNIYLATDTGKEFFKNSFLGIIEGKNGTLWLNGPKAILNFDPETHEFKRYTSNPDDQNAVIGSENGIIDILVDKSGLLWVTFINHEVDIENRVTSAFSIWAKQPSNPKGYPGDSPGGLITDKEGFVWFTNKAGIYKWLPGSDTFLQIYKNPANTFLRGLALDKYENIYFSSAKGLLVLNKKSRRVHIYSSFANDSTSISSGKINRLLVDHTGLVWIGTNINGINSFDPATQKFRRYPFIVNDGHKANNGKLDDQRVLTIYEDRQGNIWIGTNRGGLCRFDRKTGKFKSYLLNKEIHLECVDAIFEDREGRLWVGSYLNGLCEFNVTTSRYVRHINEDTGLLFNTVDDVLQDEKGLIWATSARGLTSLNPADGSIKRYPLNSIMPGVSAAVQLNDLIASGDHFILGLANSIVQFKPADLAGNTIPPEVHIEKISHNNPGAKKEIPSTVQIYGQQKIDLPWNQNRITLTYVALHFINPAQNKYAYYMDGYDKQWVQAGAQREVTYTNLSPGTYTFRVKAANSDGIWNNHGDSFLIIIRSPWWFTWWAWLLYLAMFTTAIYAFIIYRSRYLVLENRQLEQKVADRTKQLSEQQEEITTQRDQLADTITDLKATQNQLIQSEKMASLGELTAGIAHEIQNPLNFVNNFSEVSKELMEELSEELDKGDIKEVKAISLDVIQNLEKINHHGKRADFIVKGMLQHSHNSTGERQLTNINVLADEFLKLSYHGLRAKDKSFNAEIVTHFAPDLPKVNIVQQDIGRVLLNLFNNAFYAVNEKQKTVKTDYKPAIAVSTYAENGHVIIKVKDNGIGIPDAIKDKIMQPFFTTKPTGEGTGLGLSLSYDMVVKGHGGKIELITIVGEFTEFIVTLPLNFG